MKKRYLLPAAVLLLAVCLTVIILSGRTYMVRLPLDGGFSFDQCEVMLAAVAVVCANNFLV